MTMKTKDVPKELLELSQQIKEDDNPTISKYNYSTRATLYSIQL